MRVGGDDMGRKLVLASASQRRLKLLQQVGIEVSLVMPTELDETSLPREKPRHLAERLARAKLAAALSSLRAGDHGLDCKEILVLAADTVVSVGRRLLPKALCPEEAFDCLRMLSGRTHFVRTAVAASSKFSDKARIRVSETRVYFKRLSDEEINRYVASREWYGKAGGYGLQGLADTFVRKLSGSYTGVMGLPLLETIGLITGE